MPDSVDWNLIERCLAGECSGEDRAALQRWAEEDEGRRELLAALTEIWASAEKAKPRYDSKAAWRAVGEAIGRPSAESRPSSQRHESAPVVPIRVTPAARRAPRYWARAAAIVAALVGGGVLWTSTRHLRVPIAEDTVAREVTTERGQRARLRLADGTRVLLGPESRFQEFAGFGRRTRTVSVVGDAYFEVTHDPERPFIVRAGSAVTEVLGTSFGVRAYPEQTDVHVAVRNGRVRLRSARTDTVFAAILTPGQLGRLDGDGHVELRTDVTADEYLGWTSGRITFRDTPLREVIPQLARWYDIDIAQPDDPRIRDLLLTASFEDAPSSDVLDVIARSLGLSHRRVEGRIEFYRPDPPRGNP